MEFLRDFWQIPPMKTFILPLILLSLSTQAHALSITDVSMFGYLRAGSGTNTYGGDQECFYNQGSGGWNGVGRNEFRLGNECSNYLELGLRFNHLKTETQNVFTQFRIANSHSGHDSFESKNQTTDFVEAFAEIQGMNDLPWSFWVGKRFYRDQDVYIDDFYYFGSMNGNGAGIGNIPLLGGELSLAYLREVSDVKTSKGLQGLTVYDARLKNVQIANKLKQNFWLAFGKNPESEDVTTKAKYEKATGIVVGTLLDYDLSGGFNHFSIVYGQGIMNNFNLYGDVTTTAVDDQKDQKRLRLINHTTHSINERWAFHSSINYDHMTRKSYKEQWMGMALRPVYRVTPTFHLVSEVGSSIVKENLTRRLTRLTLAPQLSISENIWGRPVLRAFYTHSFWNKANQSFVAQSAPTYGNKTSGGAYGFQVETFF